MKHTIRFENAAPRGAGGIRRSRLYASVVAVGIAALGMGSAARAQTTGSQQGDIGDIIRADLGFRSGLRQPGSPMTALDPPGTLYNFIKNPYMAVTQGINAARPTPYAIGQLVINEGTGLVNASGITLSMDVAGMLSFGNIGGSLRYKNDDMRALNGLGRSENYIPGLLFFAGNGGNVPTGFGVWPLPGRFFVTIAATPYFDYSSYVQANLDGTQAGGSVTGGKVIQVVGGDGMWDITPTFRTAAGDSFLLSQAQLGNNVSLNQQIRLFRNTAQLRWQVVNADTKAHIVYLKFVVNNRPAQSFKLNTDLQTFTNIPNSFFYADPSKGPTLRSQVYGINPDGVVSGTAGAIPPVLEVLGARYQPDTNLGEPYHARFVLSGAGATPPSTVFVGDSEDLFPVPIGGYPNTGTFSPQRAGVRLDKMENGIATAVYFGPINVQAGATSAPIITYYGNGGSTESLEPDFAIGTEAEEAFQYNSAAGTAVKPTITAGNFRQVASQFLTPSALTIYGSIYNRQLSESQFNITLPDVRMSVTLPDALQFTTNPTTGLTDTATKAVGDIPGDQDRVAQWYAQPSGDQFGTFAYQLTANIGGISPLSRTISRSVTIPATPLHQVIPAANGASNYQQIGFPFDFDPAQTNNSDVASILQPYSQPPANDNGDTTLYQWTPDPNFPDTGKYSIATKIVRGKGYFYSPAKTQFLYLNGARPDTQATPNNSNQNFQYYQTVLERGWNMVTNPWVYSVPVSYISLATIDNTNPNGDLNLTYFPDAVSQGLVRGGIFFYNTGTKDYDFFQDFTQQLKPYQGYWIYVDDRRVLRIAVPTQPQSALIPAPDGTIPVTRGAKVPAVVKEPVGALASNRAFPAQATPTNWKLQLSAKRAASGGTAGAQDNMTLLGVSPYAKDGDDSTDLPKPPPIFENYVSVRILHTLKSGKVGKFAQDMKGSNAGKKTWDLEVTSDKDGPVVLSWPNLSHLPRAVHLMLSDKTGRNIPLSGASSTVVNVSAGAPSTFTLTASQSQTQPLAFTDVRMTNQGGTRAAGSGTNYALSFHVTTDTQVDARVMAFNGKTVGVLATGRAAVANGENRFLWNGRAQNGSAIPAGSYMVELSARSAAGETASVKRPFLVLR